TGDGHRVYFEACGRPDGKPAVVLHGGPGSGCSTRHRRLFDPDIYNVVLFDQRGCGRSEPHAAVSLDALTANTTAHLLADIEALRLLFGFERWLVFGGSWGCTLGLAYAQAHPHRVSELVLAGVISASRAELDWLYGDIGMMMPDYFEAFRAGAPSGEAGIDMARAYAGLLASSDRDIAARAAADWCRWEASLVEVDPRSTPSPHWRDPAFVLAFARLVTHYFSHDCWLEERQIIGSMDRIAHLPGAMIHSRFDPSAPLWTAWTLSREWPAATLKVLDGALHSATSGPMAAAVVEALDLFGTTPR
ncbi:MAG: prolyl aminopeptidase, partial [Hydrogenophaga sp.]|nr:prolyl aminopeptidase [Hydrogenophaga sp.]